MGTAIANEMGPRAGPLAPSGIDRLILRWPRVGSTDVFDPSVTRRGLWGKLCVLLFGTPDVATFTNGIYLRRVAGKVRFASVLDAGCGNGALAFYMARNFPYSRITGIVTGEQGSHAPETALEVCQRIQNELRYPNLRLQRLDLRDLDAKDAFDFVYSFDVLEHSVESRTILENIYRALTRDGLFLLRIPTRAHERVLGKKSTARQAAWAAAQNAGQQHEMVSLVADLKSIGYRIVAAEYNMGFWGRLSLELAEAIGYDRLPEPIRFAISPALKLLRWIDTQTDIRDGDGLLVLCRK